MCTDLLKLRKLHEQILRICLCPFDKLILKLTIGKTQNVFAQSSLVDIHPVELIINHHWN